jgi:hypothetical protein
MLHKLHQSSTKLVRSRPLFVHAPARAASFLVVLALLCVLSDSAAADLLGAAQRASTDVASTATQTVGGAGSTATPTAPPPTTEPVMASESAAHPGVATHVAAVGTPSAAGPATAPAQASANVQAAVEGAARTVPSIVRQTTDAVQRTAARTTSGPADALARTAPSTPMPVSAAAHRVLASAGEVVKAVTASAPGGPIARAGGLVTGVITGVEPDVVAGPTPPLASIQGLGNGVTDAGAVLGPLVAPTLVGHPGPGVLRSVTQALPATGTVPPATSPLATARALPAAAVPTSAVGAAGGYRSPLASLADVAGLRRLTVIAPGASTIAATFASPFRTNRAAPRIGGGRTSPPPPGLPSPASSSSSTASGSAGVVLLFFLTLATVVLLSGPRRGRRVLPAQRSLRPSPFVLLPERPG